MADIASVITALNADIVNARSKIVEMGGTVTSGGGSSQLASDIATIPQGGGSGFNVYYYHGSQGGGSGDGAYIRVNGGDAIRLVQPMPDTGYSYYGAVFTHEMQGVETLKMWGFDHSGSYPISSASWVRYRPHSGGAWTNYTTSRSEADAQLLTLTCDIDLEIFEGTCLNKGTLISMADGTKKPVEEIEVGDVVKGYDGNKVVRRSQKGSVQFLDFRDVWYFEGGIQIITTGRHEFYNYTKQSMMYLDEWEIGDRAVAEDGSHPVLIQHNHEDIPCMHFSLWVEENADGFGENYFAGGLLSGNRFTGELKIE